MELPFGLLVPLIGTSLGAACVFFLRGGVNRRLERSMNGFAAGVMTAASVWSLLIPAIEQAASTGAFAFLPAVVGLWLGVGFLLLLDWMIPPMSDCGPGRGTKMMVLAVTLHNLPEGMAVGVALAGWRLGSPGVTGAAVIALALGIAIQNFPEGAIISLPLKTAGYRRIRAFCGGVLSGLVEPLGAGLTLLAAQLVVPILPYVLSFAAGAMLYVVVEELVPEMIDGDRGHLGTVCFVFGFSAMMALDVALG